MTDYIRREDAIKAIMDLPNCPNGYSDTYDKARIIAELEELPSAFYELGEEIVYCQDCEYAEYPGTDYPCCTRHYNLGDYNEYCSDGRRNDE